MNNDVESSWCPRLITGEMNRQTKFALVVIGIGIFLMVVLLPLSYIGVEYYELGLRKQKSTGKVKLDKVYASGRYMIGPDYTFKTFQADAHYEELSKIVTFSSDKVEVEITCAMQYFLRPEDLKDMHQEYDLYYKPVVRTTANAAIKSRATELAVSQFIRDRLTVERELFKALKERLEGRCCRIDCAETNTCTGCIEHSKCKTSDKGLFVEVRYFQFLDFDIHSDVKSRYLRQVTEREQEEQAQYELKEKVVRKETERRKNEFINAAAEIEQEAKTNATIIRAKANAEALLIVEKARDKGLSLLYQQLNITEEEHKAAFNYLRTLRGQKNVKLNVGYNTLMARD